MGVYAIQAALFAFREYPTAIKGTGVVTDEGVDSSFQAELTFPNGGKAFLKCGATMDGFDINDYVVVGTKGTMIVSISLSLSLRMFSYLFEPIITIFKNIFSFFSRKLHQIWSSICLTDIDGTFKEFRLPAAKRTAFYWNSVGLRYEAMYARDAILAGKLEEDTNMPHEESIRIARIEDEIRRQIGVVYPQDAIEY